MLIMGHRNVLFLMCFFTCPIMINPTTLDKVDPATADIASFAI